MRYRIFPVLVVTVLLSSDSARAAESNAAGTAALHAVLAKNVAHARDWLDQKDFKSLAQSAGGLQLLAELLKARSDDAMWQAATGNLVSAATAVQAASRDEDAGKCQQALDALDKATSAAAALKPSGKPQALSRAPAIRPLMLTMDAIQADAKIGLLTGNVEAAKKQAAVLAEMGKLVSNSKATEQWSSLAGDFVTAATAAADSTNTDAKIARQQFRGIAERCEACHEKSRAR